MKNISLAKKCKCHIGMTGQSAKSKETRRSLVGVWYKEHSPHPYILDFFVH